MTRLANLVFPAAVLLSGCSLLAPDDRELMNGLNADDDPSSPDAGPNDPQPGIDASAPVEPPASPQPSPSPSLDASASAPLSALLIEPDAPVDLGLMPGEWAPLEGALLTPWARSIEAEQVHQAYPRPRLVRQVWGSLNGLWDYALRTSADSRPGVWDGQLLVPFPLESALSGLGRSLMDQDRLWYRRTFMVPDAWRSERLLLRFGAVDHEATVWVNDEEVGHHIGGFDGFSFDITDHLSPGEEQEILVRVSDRTDVGRQVVGSQALDPNSETRTAVSGIWQSVWLEPVPTTRIDRLELSPTLASGSDAAAGEVSVSVWSEQPLSEHELRVNVIADGEVVASGVDLGSSLTVQLPEPRRWTPDDPFLYDVDVQLWRDNDLVDRVASYFGIRDARVVWLDRPASASADSEGSSTLDGGLPIADAGAGDAGGRGPDAWVEAAPDPLPERVARLEIGGTPAFIMAVTEEGYWPGGLYTAPSDEALKSDIQRAKQLGFSMLHKPEKIEPERWYYWCDRLGMLVWQEMPSGPSNSPDDASQFRDELLSAVDKSRHHPSVLVWEVPYSEQLELEPHSLIDDVKQASPGTLVEIAGADSETADDFNGRAFPGVYHAPSSAQHLSVLSGLGRLGGEDNGNVEQRTEDYREQLSELWGLHEAQGLAIAIFEQLADVESNQNGLFTYDRSGVKVDLELVGEINSGDVVRDLPWLQTSRISSFEEYADERQRWHFTSEPQANLNWTTSDFDPSPWLQVEAPIRNDDGTGFWDASRVYLRRDFWLDEEPNSDVVLFGRWDDIADFYINGVFAATASLAGNYRTELISHAARQALRPGRNTIAWTVLNTGGAGVADLGIVELGEPLVPIAPLELAGLQAGLKFRAYTGNHNTFPGFGNKTIHTDGWTPFPSLEIAEQEDNYQLLFDGYINVPDTGMYTFFSESTDGSRVRVADQLVVDINRRGELIERGGSLLLEAGLHKVRFETFQRVGDEQWSVHYAGPGTDRRPISEAELHTEACGGIVVIDQCWYFGASGDSCDTTCELSGGVDQDNAELIGPKSQGGAVQNCQAIAEVLELDTMTSIASDEGGLGCTWSEERGLIHSVDDHFDSEFAQSGYRRVCGCND